MSIKLIDAAQYFNKEPHQLAAWNWLESKVSTEILSEFSDKYRTKTPAKPTFANTWDGVQAAGRLFGAKFPEVVAAQWALESSRGKHTSGTHNYFGLKGSGSDVGTKEFINGKWITITAGFINFPDLPTCVKYLIDHWYKDFEVYKGVNRAANRNECARLLMSEGYAAQLKALQSLGLKAKFINNGSAATLENEIRNNRPVACGWLHQGPVSKPTGGGHWGVICGFTATHFVIHDPFGEGNMVAGNYINNSSVAGKNVRYNKKDWLARWEVDGRNTGWAILVSK
jgi:hypothetical protein